MIAATVGVILRAIQERVGFLGRIIVGMLGVGWTIATFLVVPVLVARDKGPVDSIKDSAALLKQTWGENVIGQAKHEHLLRLAVRGAGAGRLRPGGAGRVAAQRRAADPGDRVRGGTVRGDGPDSERLVGHLFGGPVPLRFRRQHRRRF
ncbi:DUF6159 family protein [Massilia sp. B-10]|nr:DUF6159 family protein [Massilia sp. B-10]